jgi:hypothetical protein
MVFFAKIKRVIRWKTEPLFIPLEVETDHIYSVSRQRFGYANGRTVPPGFLASCEKMGCAFSVYFLGVNNKTT